ncbi:Tubulin/FtsZ family, GTPase domain-containing protein [Phlyctochytrium arcticum]|nr:Tubulin/FtsZ family, GTPase domain-containing protein [Phlyctochytrium arcticum]
MPNCIVVQVGQCGNQIGGRFWDMVLQEHAKYNSQGHYNESLATFFRNVNTETGESNISVGNGKKRITGLKARGVLVDMEEGVINQIQSSPLAELFDPDQVVTSNSGSGNNWAVGNYHYGPIYREEILEAVRRQAEYCDALQSFFMIGSLGGGTGSGLGSYICEMLQDEFPECYRFYTTVSPSANDDVVTSPYNSILSLSKLIDTADCILPLENQALLDIVDRIDAQTRPKRPTISRDRVGASLAEGGQSVLGGMCGSAVKLKAKSKPFDGMNNIAANLLMNLTSSMRFEGTMNVDINDIVTNLVPYPRLKLLVSSMTPLYMLADTRAASRSLDQMFLDAFSRESQLIKADPRTGTYLACALFARGDVEISDVRRNIDRMISQLKFVHWNQEGWKTGLCSIPPISQPRCLLTLSNNTCITETCRELHGRFRKLYTRKANLHHYTQYMDAGDITAAGENVAQLIAEYRSQRN